MTSSERYSLAELTSKLDHCRSSDRHSLYKGLQQLQRRLQEGKPGDRLFRQLSESLEKSLAVVTSRQALVPDIHYDDQLPIAGKREEIKSLIRDNQVVVIAGETGSGKTTQLPKICLELGLGSRGLIGHTQPRRIAARSVASRIAEELKCPLGNQVGYQVRFTDQCGPNTLIKLMTDGILLAEIQRDRYLSQYDTLIIDEAHERSLNIDFLLGFIKQLLPKRPDLKVIITSATIDVEKFSSHFDNAPVMEVSGRTYPVEMNYRQPSEEQSLAEQIEEAVGEIYALPKRGDVLVFLSGEREIREVAAHLRKCQLPHTEIVPLYARLSLAEQAKVFQPHRGVRIVLATNVAETSLTVPGIRYVIDPGFCRISRYSYRTKVQRLPIEVISRASANQRAGRCGRVSEGVCFRLYSEDDFNNRPEFTDPEILRTNLASVILQMLQMRIGEIRHFPFIDKPDNRQINDGFNLLYEISATDNQGRLTRLGKTIASFPIDPRLSAMLVAAANNGALKEVLVIVSALSIQDPRERPAEKKQAADEKHRQWQDKESDFTTLLNIWQHFEEQRQQLSRNQFEKYCRQNFISPLRLREWRDLHHQVHNLCRQMGLKTSAQSAGYEAIHRSLLAGFSTQIGNLSEGREYAGTRNRKFMLFPASGLAKKPPKWVISAEMIETGRLYAHNNARIDPEWLPPLVSHLVKKSYSEPHYSARQGQVVAMEKQSLLGLPIVVNKPVSYGKIDPELSRQLFIRGALVEGKYSGNGKHSGNGKYSGNGKHSGNERYSRNENGKGQFFSHNQALIQEIETLEAKFRRQDILVDDETIFAFYNARVPGDITTLAGFEKWRKQAEVNKPELLYLSKDYLAANLPGAQEQAQFPDHIHWQGVDYPLSYHFEPGSEQDGVTVSIPVSLLHQAPRYLFEWLVPGLLGEKLIELVKALPKSLRRHFVPVPGIVEKILPEMQPTDQPLVEALALQLQRQTGVEVKESDWNLEKLDNYYKMNFRLLDDNGKQLAQGRELELLKAQFKSAFRDTVQQPAGADYERSSLSDWDFGDLPKLHVIEKEGLAREGLSREGPTREGLSIEGRTREGLAIRTYPALVVEDNRVALRLLDNPEKAEYSSRAGIAELACLAYPKTARYLEKQLLQGVDLKLAAARLDVRKTWVHAIIRSAYGQVFADAPLPRTREEFEAIFKRGSNGIVSTANAYEQLLLAWLEPLIEIRQKLARLPAGFAKTRQDIEQQLIGLVYPSVFIDTDIHWLKQYSRYFQAIILRLEKLPGQQEKDEYLVEEIAQFRDKTGQLEDVSLLNEATRQELEKYRFMLEEYRVSSFAQQLGTLMPVSPKRLEKQWVKVSQ